MGLCNSKNDQHRRRHARLQERPKRAELLSEATHTGFNVLDIVKIRDCKDGVAFQAFRDQAYLERGWFGSPLRLPLKTGSRMR
jgi:hypothetical protein